MMLEKESLNVYLLNGEEEADSRIVFQVQNGDPMILRQMDDSITTLPVKGGSGLLREAVGHIVEDPVEHLDEEGKFGKDATVHVMTEARASPCARKTALSSGQRSYRFSS